MFTISQQVKLNELDKACRVSFAYWYKTRTYEAEINYMYWVQEKANFQTSILEMKSNTQTEELDIY